MNRTTLVFCIILLGVPAAAQSRPAAKAPPGPAAEWLAVCSRCPSPTVIAKTGIGTAHAVAEARMTGPALRESCMETDPQAVEACVRRETANPKLYRATADCLAGRITPIDGNHYRLAGVWDDSDIGGGRTKWRGADGAIVGRDNASNGLAISQQWEVLCPGPPPLNAAAAPAGPGAAPSVASAAPPPAARPAVCTGQPFCAEGPSFAATVADFRTSSASGIKLATASVRFQNKLARPVILGYVAGSGVVTDDQGNRYLVATSDGVRGIGWIGNGQADPKFMLRPGETGDARFEMAWRWSGREIFGLKFDMEFTVREMLPTPSGQLRLGPEHPISFRGLANAAASAPAVLASSTSAPAAASIAPAQPPAPLDQAPAANAPDACAGIPRCFHAGPFLAEVQQISSSVAGGRHHVLRFTVRFRNLSSQQLILATTYNSLVAVDNEGHRYGMTPQEAVSGMGISASNRADPQFVLNPGQSRTAAFQVYRRNSGPPTGVSYTFDASVEQLEILPSQQIRSVRQYSLNFPNLAVSGMSGAAPPESLGDTGRKLVDLMRGKKK